MGEKDKLALVLPLGEVIDSGVSFLKKDRLNHESMRSLHLLFDAFVLVGGTVQGATPTRFLAGWTAFRRNPGAH